MISLLEATNVLWTIYWNPKDFIGLYVVRPWYVMDGHTEAGRILGTGKTIDEARGLLPDDAINLGRCGPDDPCIVETWI